MRPVVVYEQSTRPLFRPKRKSRRQVLAWLTRARTKPFRSGSQESGVNVDKENRARFKAHKSRKAKRALRIGFAGLWGGAHHHP